MKQSEKGDVKDAVINQTSEDYKWLNQYEGWVAQQESSRQRKCEDCVRVAILRKTTGSKRLQVNRDGGNDENNQLQ